MQLQLCHHWKEGSGRDEQLTAGYLSNSLPGKESTEAQSGRDCRHKLGLSQRNWGLWSPLTLRAHGPLDGCQVWRLKALHPTSFPRTWAFRRPGSLDCFSSQRDPSLRPQWHPHSCGPSRPRSQPVFPAPRGTAPLQCGAWGLRVLGEGQVSDPHVFSNRTDCLLCYCCHIKRYPALSPPTWWHMLPEKVQHWRKSLINFKWGTFCFTTASTHIWITEDT